MLDGILAQDICVYCTIALPPGISSYCYWKISHECLLFSYKHTLHNNILDFQSSQRLFVNFFLPMLYSNDVSWVYDWFAYEEERAPNHPQWEFWKSLSGPHHGHACCFTQLASPFTFPFLWLIVNLRSFEPKLGLKNKIANGFRSLILMINDYFLLLNRSEQYSNRTSIFELLILIPNQIIACVFFF